MNLTIIPLQIVGSTNDEAARYLAAGAAGHGTVITATEQVAARGRAGRTWESPPGNLYASLVLKPARPQQEWAQICFVISLAVAEALEKILPRGRHVQVKWPNDVLVQQRKICGILLEISGDHLIVGIGVNCRHVPATPHYPATSLAAEGAVRTPEQALEAILAQCVPLFNSWQQGGMSAIHAAWLEKACKLGQPIIARLADATAQHGLFRGMDPDSGALLLEQDGVIRHIACADVFFSG